MIKKKKIKSSARTAKENTLTPRVVAAKAAPRVESRTAPINRRSLVAKERLSKTQELHALALASIRI